MTRSNLTSDVRTLDFFTVPTAVPEPAAWAMMLLGFGLAGGVAAVSRAVRSRV